MRTLKTYLTAGLIVLVPVMASAQASRLTRLDSSHNEDAVAASGDTGQLCLGVRNDAGTALGADGDYLGLQINSSGALVTTCTLSAGTEDAAETAGGALAMIGSVVRAGKTGSTATAGDNATVNVDANGGLWSASDQIEDAAETAGTPLAMAGCVVRAGKTGSTATAADNATCNVTTDGGLWGASDQIEDAAEADAMPLAMIGGVARTTVVGSSATSGDQVTLNLSTSGGLYTNEIGNPTVVSGVITVTTAGTSVQGASNTVKECWFSGPATNTGQCFIASSTGDHRLNALPILETASIGPVHISNTNLVWADCITSGDLVTFFCTN